jgi:hypothetical protein
MPSPNSNVRFRVALASSLVLLTLLALPMLQGCIYVYDDLGDFHLPLRSFYADCLRNGDSFDWCPRLFCGFYLQGEGQAGLYHPLHRTLYGWLPLCVALNLEVWLNYPILLGGMYFFLCRRRLPADAAMFGAMVFTFSASTMLHFMHVNGIAIMAHLPWLLLLIDLALTAPPGRVPALAGLGIALLTTSQLLLGLPQYVYFCFLTELLYTLYLLRERPGVGRLAALGGWMVLGVAGGAVQWLPTWEALRDSRREAPTAEFLATGSLHPANLTQLVAPYLYQSRVFGGASELGIDTHEFGLYPGAAATVLWLWLLLRWPRNEGRRSLAVAALALAALSLLLAFGKYTLLFEWTRRLPVVNLFRCPCKYLVLFHLATGVAAALAFADLANPQRSIVSWPPFVLLVIGSVLALALPMTSASAFSPLPWRLTGPLLIGAAVLLVFLASTKVRGAPVALIVFVALDQGAYGLSFLWHDPPVDIATYTDATSAPPARDGERVCGTIAGLEMDVLTLRGLNLADGYVALYPRTSLDLSNEDSLRLAGVRWAHRGDSWHAILDPLPRARMVSRAQSGQESPTVDFATTALVDEQLSLVDATPGSATLTEDRPGRIVLDVECKSRQLLIVAESYHRGWQVLIDGNEATVTRVHDQFLGCVVEEGRHQVEFLFRPASLALGKGLTGLALALMTLWLLLALLLPYTPILRSLADRSVLSVVAARSAPKSELSSFQPLTGADK